jgi:hypothetical protein
MSAAGRAVAADAHGPEAAQPLLHQTKAIHDPLAYDASPFAIGNKFVTATIATQGA